MSNPPVPKYTATVKITANSHEELDDRIQSLAVNWGHHHTRGWSRDTIDSTDGTTTVRLEHTNPEQTPEAYRSELSAWAADRRAARHTTPHPPEQPAPRDAHEPAAGSAAGSSTGGEA